MKVSSIAVVATALQGVNALAPRGLDVPQFGSVNRLENVNAHNNTCYPPGPIAFGPGYDPDDPCKVEQAISVLCEAASKLIHRKPLEDSEPSEEAKSERRPQFIAYKTCMTNTTKEEQTFLQHQLACMACKKDGNQLTSDQYAQYTRHLGYAWGNFTTGDPKTQKADTLWEYFQATRPWSGYGNSVPQNQYNYTWDPKNYYNTSNPVQNFGTFTYNGILFDSRNQLGVLKNVFADVTSYTIKGGVPLNIVRSDNSTQMVQSKCAFDQKKDEENKLNCDCAYQPVSDRSPPNSSGKTIPPVNPQLLGEESGECHKPASQCLEKPTTRRGCQKRRR